MSDLTFKVLGCSGTYAAAGEACSGYLLRSLTTTIWVDCGPGTLANLQKEVKLTDLDAIIVSHHHPDHCAELPVAYNAAKYYLDIERIPVLAPRDVQRVTEAFQSFGDTSDLFEWKIVSDGDTAQVGDISVRFSQTDHPVETLAMRFDCGDKSVVFTSDTGSNWSLSKLGRDPGLVVGEGTFLHAEAIPEVSHVSCVWLAEQANQVGAKQLVVTHVPPGSDPAEHLAEAAAVFEGPAFVASTGATFQA